MSWRDGRFRGTFKNLSKFGILVALFLASGVKKMILTGDSDKKRTVIWMLFLFLYLAALFLTQAMRMWVV